MLQITEQQAAASAHSGLHGVAQMAIKTLAITSTLTMIVASAPLSIMESGLAMHQYSDGCAPALICVKPFRRVRRHVEAVLLHPHDCSAYDALAFADSIKLRCSMTMNALSSAGGR
jgi:hypothetical protein